MENFQSLGLPEALLNALNAMKYEIPTPIQAQTIPSALEGKFTKQDIADFKRVCREMTMIGPREVEIPLCPL